MKIVKLNKDANITRGSSEAAGYDLYSVVTANIPPHSTVMISTGLSMEIPKGYFGGIFARSGLATKQGLRPANCVGVVDSDYRGEVMVALHNDTDTEKVVSSGDRIAQLVVIPYKEVDLDFVETLDDTERGTGGFGSTGV